ncbi:MAG: SOS response-associated peptidase family protein [Rhodanobacter sp.]
MCFSAEVWAGFREFEREFGAVLSIRRYADLFWELGRDGTWHKIPKAMRAAFAHPRNEEEMELAKLVADGDRARVAALQQEIAEQSERLADAEKILSSPKPTKKAANDQRIATKKVKAAQRGLADLQRKEPVPADSRIFPGQYATVLITHEGQRILVPMRYQCRLPGWTEAIERKYPGSYNARRDRLKESWSKLFGYHHGVIVAEALFENVWRHAAEQRELAPGEEPENVVIEFKPVPRQSMLIACLWSFCKGRDGEPDLYSFAAITDEPPPEVIEAGHDRFVVQIKPENLDAWLDPDPNNLDAMYAILDDRPRPYYASRMAA